VRPGLGEDPGGARGPAAGLRAQPDRRRPEQGAVAADGPGHQGKCAAFV